MNRLVGLDDKRSSTRWEQRTHSRSSGLEGDLTMTMGKSSTCHNLT